MSIDPFAEELLTLSEAARFCPRHRQGKKPHSSTFIGGRPVVRAASFSMRSARRAAWSRQRKRCGDSFAQLSMARPLPLPHQSPTQNDRHHAAVEEGIRDDSASDKNHNQYRDDHESVPDGSQSTVFNVVTNLE